MPQIINTNIASLNIQRNLNTAQRNNETALQRLSSGLRINSAKDDAAGLAISTRFDAQVRGTQTAIRNSGDAISLAQTAEGALSSMTTSLQRVRELAIQAANDTNTSIDRQALQEEVDQLVNEIENIASTSNFNGKKLLDGSFQNAVFQTGANVGDTVTVSVSRLDTNTLGSAVRAGLSSNSTNPANGYDASGTGADANLDAGDLVINGIAVRASTGSDDSASTALQASSSIAKAAAINTVSNLTGVEAVVNQNAITGRDVNTTTTGSTVVQVNGISINLAVDSTLSVEQNFESVAQAINEKSGASGVRATVVPGGLNGSTFRVDLIADDGRNIVLTSTAGDVGVSYGIAITSTTGRVYVGTYSLLTSDGSDVDISTNTGNIDNAGFEEGVFSGVNGGVVSDNGNTSKLSQGDVTINGVSVGPSSAADDVYSTVASEGSAIAKAAAINKIADRTGVSAEANANTLYSGTITATTAAADFTVNGVNVSVSFGSTADFAVKLAAIVDAVNQKSGQTGVVASALDEDSFKLVAEDGRNITTTNASTYNIDSTTHVASITLVSAGTFTLGSITGDLGSAGLRIGTFGGGESGTKLRDIDITTVEGANAAIKAVDNALQTITTKQAELGAVQNRFSNTIANLEALSENLSAANSRIKDADFAAESAALSKTQVLQQAGISVLAQANAGPQQVLSLLGG